MTEYLRPNTLDEALQALSEHGEAGKPLAGGLAIGVLLRAGLVTPGVLIDIRGMPELSGIRVDESGDLLIGAAVTHREIELSPIVQQGWPALSEMESLVGSIQVRNNGTIGGNLCHADPAGDPPTVLCTLDAAVNLRSTRGQREVPLNSFFKGYFESVLEPDEIMTHLRVPRLKSGTGCAYLKHATRAAVDFPTVAAAALITLKDGRIEKASVALAAVGATPHLCSSAGTLIGQQPSTQLWEEFGKAVSEETDPPGDASASGPYKKHAAGVLAKRVALEATARAQKMLESQSQESV